MWFDGISFFFLANVKVLDFLYSRSFIHLYSLER